MTSAELWGQNSLVGPFFPYQDRHWKTARHEKIEASELKPSEEKKSIMVWSLSNLTTEIRPGKHLENPTKNGTNANRNLWNLNTLYTALWDFWWMGFWIKKFPLDWNPKKKGARQSTKTPPSDRKSRWVHGIGWPFFFWYRSLAWPVSFGQDLLRACVKLNLIWINPTWCRFFLSRDDIPVICYWIVIPKTLMKRNTVLAGWEHFDSRLESSRSFEHLWSDLFVKLGIRRLGIIKHQV